MSEKALVIVDVQRDFLPGGSLAVPGGDEIIPGIVELVNDGGYNRIIATGDWHPDNHCSFKDYGGDWPVHCVKYTNGAMYPSDLLFHDFERVLKGVKRNVEEYSGFYAANDQLDLSDITSVDIVGLALDYCVKATALDFVRAGYDTSIYLDLTKAVTADGAATTILAFQDAGVKVKFYDPRTRV